MRRALVWIVLGVVLVLGVLLWLSPSESQPGQFAPLSESNTARVESANAASPKHDTAPLATDAETPHDTARAVAAAPESAAAPLDPNTPGVLTVVVVAKETGAPLAKMSVSVRDPAAVRPKPAGAQRGTQIETSEHGELGLTVFTTASGRITFEVPPGVNLDARAWSPNQRASTGTTPVKALAPGEHREVRFELLTRDDGAFCGLVVDRETRTPLADAVIGGGPIGGRASEVARTDGDGRFRMTFASWRFFELEATKPGYAPQLFWPDESAPVPEHPFVIELARAASLVVTLRGYVPANGARPVLVASTPRSELAHELQRRSRRSSSAGDRKWTAEFDAGMRAELDDLPCGAELTLAARDENQTIHQPLETLELAPRERRELVWEFDAGCKLTVHALDADGRAQPNVELWLLDDELGAMYLAASDRPAPARCGKTDENGVVVFDAVAPRVWRVGPATRSVSGVDPKAFAPVAHVFRLAPGVRELTVELHLERALHIRGVVLDPDGKPRKAAVSTHGEHGVVQGAIDTQADGTFVIGPLAAGKHQLRASGSGDVLESDEVEVAAGALDVELRLKRGAGFRGRVVHAANGGSCAAQVVCTQLAPPSAKLRLIDTTPDGVFEFHGLEPGRYGVSAIGKDGRAGVCSGIEVAFDHETPEVTVKVAPGARVRVRFEAPSSSLGLVATCDGVRVAYDGVSAGGQALLRVPAGAVRLSIARGNVDPWRVDELTLTAGEERELVIR